MKLGALILILSYLVGASTVWAAVNFTSVGKEISNQVPLVAPQLRVKNVYHLGDSRVIIDYPNLKLVPIGEGESMMPLVTSGHKLLLATGISMQDVEIGDFIVVDNVAGRYFHQVVRKGDGFLITRGLMNSSDDLVPVDESEIVGVAIAVIW